MGKSNNPRFYWLKLREDFINGEVVDFILSQENGSEYFTIYQLLCIKCINKSGMLATVINEVIIPFDVKKITRDLKYFEYDTVVVALELFKQLGLVYNDENGSLIISEFNKMVGSETKDAERKRLKRSQEEDCFLGQNSDNVRENSENCPDLLGQNSDNVRLEIRDKSKDIKDNIMPDSDESGESIKPSLDQIDDFFKRVWKLYPRKEGKARVSEKKKRELYAHGYDVIKLAIERYQKRHEGEEWYKWQHGSTFFTTGYVDYLDEHYEEPVCIGSSASKRDPPKNNFANHSQREYNFDQLEHDLIKSNR